MPVAKAYHLPEALRDLEPAFLRYCEQTGKDPETVVMEALRVALSPLLKVQLPPRATGALVRQEPLQKAGTGLPMARERVRGYRTPKKKAAKKPTKAAVKKGSAKQASKPAKKAAKKSSKA